MSNLFDRIRQRSGKEDAQGLPDPAQPTTTQPALPSPTGPASGEEPTQVHPTAATRPSGPGATPEASGPAGSDATPEPSGPVAGPDDGETTAFTPRPSAVAGPPAPWAVSADGPTGRTSDPAPGDEPATEVGAAPRAPQPTPPASSGGSSPQPTGAQPGVPADPAAHDPAPAAAAPQAPAGEAAPVVPAKVSVRNRGRMRRRLRYLRRVRELGYRDLGGLVFELRRARAENEVLVGAKVDALRSIDAELHALEHGLRDFLTVEELHEPGVSVCVRCGALHGSDANFCPQCGVRVGQQAAASGVAAEPATVVAAPPAAAAGPVAPAPATVAAPASPTPAAEGTTAPEAR